MKKGALLPGADHVIRHIPVKHLIYNDDGEVVDFYPQAFELRPGEDHLSVNWIQYFDNDFNKGLIKTVHSTRKARKIGSHTFFAVANIQTIKNVFISNSLKPRIAYWPISKTNPSHSGIFHINNELEFLQNIQKLAFTKHIPNSSIPAEK